MLMRAETVLIRNSMSNVLITKVGKTRCKLNLKVAHLLRSLNSGAFIKRGAFKESHNLRITVHKSTLVLEHESVIVSFSF